MTAFQSATLIHQRGLIYKLKHRDSLNVKDSRAGSIMDFWIPRLLGNDRGGHGFMERDISIDYKKPGQLE